jgi:integrase
MSFPQFSRKAVGETELRVYIERDRNRLRIRVIYQGKKYQFSTGLTDSKTNRAYVQGIASRIELDMVSGQFDLTLLKYRPKKIGSNPTELDCPELFERFTQHRFKTHGLAPGSRSRYACVQGYVESRLNIPADKVNDRLSGDFAAYLVERLSPITAKTYLYLLAACWDWAGDRCLIPPGNPWIAHISRIKLRPSKRVKPFNRKEISLILAGFKAHKFYCHYYPFVDFLFHTGCRFGEAAGLRWCNVADDFSYVVICEAVSRGHRRDRTKTGKNRVVNLSPGISQLLKEECGSIRSKPDGLVFPAPRGGAIDDHNFLNRIWKTVLLSVGVEYRKTYAVRHSAISHALANGANPIELAEQTGHSNRVLMETYAHALEHRNLFVDFNSQYAGETDFDAVANSERLT